MTAQETPHYELYDEEKDIMIYGIKIEAISSKGIEINSQTINYIHQMMPDVVDKCIQGILRKQLSCTLVELWKFYK